MSVFGGVVEKTSGSGSGGQWSKAGTDRIKAACIGAGGSGFRDNDGDDQGGGGGGGGYAVGVTNINIGEQITWSQADTSPGRSSGKGGTNGGDSYVRRANGSNIALADGGNTGTDNSGGGAGGLGTGNIAQAGGSSGSDDDVGQDGGAAAGCSKCGDERGGQGATITWSNDNPSFGCTSCPGGINAPAFGGGGAGNDNDGTSGNGGKGYAGWAWYWADPVIDSITVTNQYNLTPGTSGGIQNAPSSTVNIAWTTQYSNKVEVRKSGVVYCTDNNGGSGNCNINTGLQSVAGSNSPATTFYNVLAFGYGGNFVKQSVDVEVKNDWTPDVSNTWITKTFIDQPPEETVTLNIGSVQGVDMPVWGYVNDSGCALGKNVSTSSNPFKFVNGDSIYLTIPTPYYEVDITGRTSEVTGNVSEKTVTVYLGSQNFDVTVKVERPVIEEDFNFGDQEGSFPNPDIDMLDNDEVYDGDANAYFITNEVTLNEIELSRGKIITDIGSGEISTEVKASDPNVQIQINNGTWQNVREL